MRFNTINFSTEFSLAGTVPGLWRCLTFERGLYCVRCEQTNMADRFVFGEAVTLTGLSASIENNNLVGIFPHASTGYGKINREEGSLD